MNSGPGRALRWRTESAADPTPRRAAIRAYANRRRSFLRALRTFDVFGKGWLRRVAEVEAISLQWHLQAATGRKPTALAMTLEAEGSERKAERAKVGAISTTARRPSRRRPACSRAATR